MEAVKEIDIGQPPDEIPPYEETPLISSDNVYFGDPQIITYSAGRDLKISTFSGADLQIGILGSEDPRPRALRSEDRTQQYR